MGSGDISRPEGPFRTGDYPLFPGQLAGTLRVPRTRTAHGVCLLQIERNMSEYHSNVSLDPPRLRACWRNSPARNRSSPPRPAFVTPAIAVLTPTARSRSMASIERWEFVRPSSPGWLGAGFAGCAAVLLMQWWMNAVDYPLLISGKPLFSLPANIPITFELIVLFSALTAFGGTLVLNQLPQFWHPVFSCERFRRVTADGFFLSIDAKDPKFSTLRPRNSSRHSEPRRWKPVTIRGPESVSRRPSFGLGHLQPSSPYYPRSGSPRYEARLLRSRGFTPFRTWLSSPGI